MHKKISSFYPPCQKNTFDQSNWLGKWAGCLCVVCSCTMVKPCSRHGPIKQNKVLCGLVKGRSSAVHGHVDLVQVSDHCNLWCDLLLPLLVVMLTIVQMQFDHHDAHWPWCTIELTLLVSRGNVLWDLTRLRMWLELVPPPLNEIFHIVIYFPLSS
jgi:hypothetical protein